MARTATAAPAARRAAPPAPPPAADEPVPSVYDEVWGVVTSVDGAFSPPGPREDDQTFIKRLIRAVSTMPEETWNTLSEEAQVWYDAGAQQFKAGQPVDAPPGFYPDDADTGETEAEPEAEVEAAPPPAPAKRTGAQALQEYNAKRKAEKEAALAAGKPAAAPATRGRAAAPAPAAPAAPAPRRGAPAAAPAAPTPRRAAAPAAAPRAAPARRAPAAAPAERGPSMVGSMREFIINELAEGREVGSGEVIAYAESQGMSPTASTVAGTLTFTKNTVETIKSMGHWQ